MSYRLLLALNNTETIKELLEPAFECTEADKDKRLLEQIRSTTPQMLLISATILLEKKSDDYHELKTDKIYYDFPVVVVYGKLADEQKEFLFTLGVKSMLQESLPKEVFITKIERTFSRVNPFVGTLRDRFVKGFIGYEDAYTFIVDMLYLANYFIELYKVEAENASNIRLAIIFLSTALKKKKLSKVMRLLRLMELSPKQIQFMENYHKAKTVEEKIILISMNALRNITDSELDSDLVAIAADATSNNRIYITCDHDIFYFCRRVNHLFGNTLLSLDISEKYLLYINDMLLSLLVQYGVVKTAFNTKNEAFYIFTVSIEEGDMVEFSQHVRKKSETFEHTTVMPDESARIPTMLIHFENLSDSTTPACVIYDNTRRNEEKIQSDSSQTQASQTPQEEVATTRTGSDKERKVDMSAINNMHYEDQHKVSAVQFLKEFEYDDLLLDDLLEDELELRDRLGFEDDFTPIMLDTVIRALEHYTHLLNETIEFRDLAYSLSVLVQLLKEVDTQTLQSDSRKMLKLYIIGIIDNLSDWRNHIFIQQSSPDIHYLDASLLNDCAQIESLLNPDVQDDEDDTLEFF